MLPAKPGGDRRSSLMEWSGVAALALAGAIASQPSGVRAEPCGALWVNRGYQCEA